MLIKFDTWDISRLELWLNLQAAQHTCSSRGQVLRAIRNQEHRVPPITRITNKHYLPYTVRLISTTMCPFTVCLLHISCIFLHTFVSENVKLFLQTWQQKQETRQASRNLHRKTREVSSAVQIRSSLFWHVTQRRLVVTDVSVTTYRPHLQRPSSPNNRSRNVVNYQSTLLNNPEEWSSNRQRTVS